MTASDTSTYSGLRLLPAVLALLDVNNDPAAARAVTVVAVERRDATSTSAEDEVAIDWTRLQDPRRSATSVRLAIARSMVDGAPVDLSEIVHFGHSRVTLWPTRVWGGSTRRRVDDLGGAAAVG
jgi:hypothetical protein